MTNGALGFVTQFASEVADGIHTLYTSYHTGDADQAAVSTAWTTFTTQAATAWVGFANSEAGAWMGYVNQTISDWQDMADTIARAAQDVVANLAPEYQAMISAIAAAAHTYLDRLADAVELRNHTVSGAVAGATVQANAAALTATNAIIGFARTHDDQVMNDLAAAYGAILGKATQFTTDMVNGALPFEQGFVGAIAGILGTLRGLSHTQVMDDLLSTKNIFQQATGTDDGIFTAWAGLQTKQSIQGAVDQREGVSSASPSQYGMTNPGRISPGMLPSIGESDSGYSSLRESLVSQYLTTANTPSAPVSNPVVAAFQNAPPPQQQQPAAAPKGSVLPDRYPQPTMVGRGGIMSLPKNVQTKMEKLGYGRIPGIGCIDDTAASETLGALLGAMYNASLDYWTTTASNDRLAIQGLNACHAYSAAMRGATYKIAQDRYQIRVVEKSRMDGGILVTDKLTGISHYVSTLPSGLGPKFRILSSEETRLLLKSLSISTGD